MSKADNKPSEPTSVGEGESLPTVQQLATLALQPRFEEIPSEAAIQEALALWKQATEFLQGKPGPRTEEIVMLATQLRLTAMPVNVALRYALAQWKQASELLRTEAEIQRLYREHYVAPVAKLPEPVSWPTTFDVFLRNVVGSDRSSVRLKRLRDFLLFEIRVAKHFERDKVKLLNANKFRPTKPDVDQLDAPADNDELVAVGERLERYRGAHLDRIEWGNLAHRYRHWWVEVCQRRKGRAGAKGAQARLEKKNRHLNSTDRPNPRPRSRKNTKSERNTT